MTIYVISFLLLVIFAFLSLNVTEKRLKDILGFFSFSVVLFLVILRKGTVGCDLPQYKLYFDFVRESSDVRILFLQFDYGYTLLNYLVGAFTDDFYVFMRLYGMMCVILLYAGIRCSSLDVSTSFLVFIMQDGYGFVCCILRQALAVFLVLLAVSYLKNGKKWLWRGLSLAAVTIHSTALVGFVYRPIIFEKKKKIFIFKIFTSFVGLSVMAFVAMPLIVNLYKRNDYSNDIGGGGGRTLFLIVSVFLCFSAYLLRKKEYSIKNNHTLAFNACAFGLAIQVMALNFSLLTRLTKYFWIFSIVLIPYVILHLKKNERILYSPAMAVLAFLWFMQHMTKDLSGIVPYQFFFQ